MFFRRLGTIVVCSVLVVGCATFGDLEEGLNGLLGQPETEAFRALGYPTTKDTFGNDTVYVWGRSTSGTYYVPQTATTTSYVGNQPVYGTTTYSQPVSYNYNCMIKIVVNNNKEIKDWEFDGNLGGCESYIGRLKKYMGK